jgi:hypothetical protein
VSDFSDLIAESNPFCTRHIRPGAMPFLFAPGQSVQLLIDRFRQADWWGEIIGPHGSGKSSLLAAITPEIEGTGRATLLVELHDGQRRLPTDLWRNPRLAAPMVLIVDGYEQLSRWNCIRLKRFCRVRRLGLLVTAHQSVGMPTLFQTSSSLALAEQIVGQLLASHDLALEPAAIRECYARQNGNLREMLFDLYDRYQQSLLPAMGKSTGVSR